MSEHPPTTRDIDWRKIAVEYLSKPNPPPTLQRRSHPVAFGPRPDDTGGFHDQLDLASRHVESFGDLLSRVLLTCI